MSLDTLPDKSFWTVRYFYVFKELSSAHQAGIYLIQNTVKGVILLFLLFKITAFYFKISFIPVIKANPNIRMISEGSCDTEDKSNNVVLITGLNYILNIKLN